jgi:hypothetical protein
MFGPRPDHVPVLPEAVSFVGLASSGDVTALADSSVIDLISRSAAPMAADDSR